MSLNDLSKMLIPFLLIILIIPSLFIPTFANNTNLKIISPELVGSFNIYNSSFYWPVPGYTRISSYFGKRNSPTAGASSFHQGIDIPAPSGSNLVATFNGIVSFTGFNGSGRICYSYKKW